MHTIEIPPSFFGITNPYTIPANLNQILEHPSIAWCSENKLPFNLDLIPTESIRTYKINNLDTFDLSNDEFHVEITFKEPEDAVLFKLVWL